MTKRTNSPAPHAGEQEAPAIPADGQTPGMGAPPQDTQERAPGQTEREPGTRPDGEAMPPAAIDPAPDGKDIAPLPNSDVADVREDHDPGDGKPDLTKEGFPREDG